MKNKSRTERTKDEDLLEEAKERFRDCLDYYNEDYKRGLDDVQFAIMGDQWDDEVRNSRKGRPCLTVNRVHSAVLQTINSIRKARPSIKVSPAGGDADMATAEVLRGVIRNIETQSFADNVYDTAAAGAVTSGYGFIRINTRYADEMSFDQEIVIERVPNQFQVLLDPNSKELDGSDAEYAFVYADVDEEVFEDKYPDFECDGEGLIGTDQAAPKETVRVAEYFYRENEQVKIYNTNAGVMTEEQYKSLPEGTVIVFDERETLIPSIKWIKFTDKHIIEKTEWLGKYIPLIPVYGEEVIDKEGRRKFLSLVHNAKDPQRRYNYWVSASTEIIALQPKTPWLGLVGQFETDKYKWERANLDNFPFLQVDPVMVQGQPYAQLPQRLPPPTGSPSMYQEIATAGEDVKMAMGVFDASIGNISLETSGVAIDSRQAQADNATFHFIDNLQTSIKHLGRCLVDLIPKYYNQPRIMRIIDDEGQKQEVAINTPLNDGSIIRFDAGKYDVVAEVGPSYETRRREVRDTLTQLSAQSPEFMAASADILAKNLDIPEADLLVDRLRRIIPALSDENPLAKELAASKQTIDQLSQTIIDLQAAIQAKQEKSRELEAVEIRKTMADTEKTIAEAKKTEVEAIKVAQDLNMQPAVAAKLTDIESNINELNQVLELMIKEREGNSQNETNSIVLTNKE